MTKSINIHAFDRQFRKEYSFLYDQSDNVAGFEEAVEAFDRFAKTEQGARFVREYCEYHSDLIASDREAAAFMFALETLS